MDHLLLAWIATQTQPIELNDNKQRVFYEKPVDKINKYQIKKRYKTKQIISRRYNHQQRKKHHNLICR